MIKLKTIKLTPPKKTSTILYKIKYQNFDVFEDFKAYVENARKAEVLGQVLQIEANDFTYQTDEDVLKEIDAFMK